MQREVADFEMSLSTGVPGGGVDEPTQMDRIRLVLLEGQALFRASLSGLLASRGGFEVVGEYGSSDEALEILSVSPVDVVLLDFDFETDGGDGFMSAARRRGYQGRFLILAGTVDARSSAMAINLGASGIFLKSEPPDRLVRAITFVANGAMWLDQAIIRLLADHSIERLRKPDDPKPGNALSDREQKVLLGVLGGLSNKKIGENLGVSEGTVKAAIQHLFHKTGVRTRSQLVRVALEGSLETAKGLMGRLKNRRAAAERLIV
jgi:DNA-binding NarL/FixJ family response regulator